MKNIWINNLKLQEIMEKFNNTSPSLPPCTILMWHGGRFPPDGAWICDSEKGPHRRIDPCTICSCKSVTIAFQDHPWGSNKLWLCEKHEKEFYKLWAEESVKDFQNYKNDPESWNKKQKEIKNARGY